MRLDQKGLLALDAVIKTQSFATAAKQLFITQPAVSQRIKNLENQFGRPLLIRSLPYEATPWGEKLLSYLRRTQLIEEYLLEEIKNDMPVRLSIALNRDSLETWFMRLLNKFNLFEKINIDIITDDQEVTIDYFKKGLVSSCITTYDKPLPGCECLFLGTMDYLLVASPSFITKYFINDSSLKDNLEKAPAIVFDEQDRLPQHFFNHFFKKNILIQQYHKVPSVQAYKQFALEGYGYGWIPRLDIIHELKQNELKEVCPDKKWNLPLYLHYWDLQAKPYQEFIKKIILVSKRYLSL